MLSASSLNVPPSIVAVNKDVDLYLIPNRPTVPPLASPWIVISTYPPDTFSFTLITEAENSAVPRLKEIELKNIKE